MPFEERDNRELKVGKPTAIGLRTATLLCVSISMLALLGILALILRKITSGGFENLNRLAITNGVNRVSDALKERVLALETSCRDWSNWTDLWRHAENRNNAFAVANLQDTVLRSLQIDHMAIIDRKKRKLFASGFNLKTDKPKTITDAELALLLDSLPGRCSPEGPGVSGIQKVGSDTLIFTSQPLRRTNGSGDSHGRIVMAISVDSGLIEDVARITHSQVRFGDEPVAGGKVGEVTQFNRPPIRVVSNRSGEFATTTVAGADGNPALTFTYKVPQDVAIQAKRVSSIVLWCVLLAGVWLVATAWAVFEFTALRRTERLCREVAEIGSTASTRERVSEGRHDEIGHLARLVNAMLDTENDNAEELQQAHRDLQRFLAAIPFMLLVFDDSGRLLECNHSAERLLFGGKNLAGEVYAWDTPLVSERDELLHYMAEAMAASKSIDLPTVCAPSPAGERMYDVELGVVESGDGVKRFLLSAIDVTERNDLQSRLGQAQKLESIGQLAAGIAHEINTPTQYVSDNTRFLQEATESFSRVVAEVRAKLALLEADPDSDVAWNEVKEMLGREDIDYYLDQVPQALAQSIDGLNRISTIVKAMKEFSHPDSGIHSAVDLNHAIENTVNVSRNEWKYVAELDLQLEPDLPAVACAVNEINQVVLNLIVNAAHAIGEKLAGAAGKGLITVSSKRIGNDRVEIAVSDTGAGIPESARSRIFDPFFTTKDVGKGTGQGLAIAHNVVVKHHHGTIDFTTAVGAGTTFRIVIPIEQPGEDLELEAA